jgi:hypothetical protein
MWFARYTSKSVSCCDWLRGDDQPIMSSDLWELRCTASTQTSQLTLFIRRLKAVVQLWLNYYLGLSDACPPQAEGSPTS